MQSNKHHILFLLAVFSCIASLIAQENRIEPLPIKAVGDTITATLLPPNILKDTIPTDSIRVDTLNKKKRLLLDKIKYKAKDSIKLSQKNQKIYLYNEAEIYYQDTELKAGVIIMDYIKNEVYAGRVKDSLGNYSQLPYFKQGENVVIPDSIRFNFDTQKALIWNSRTEQQAGLGQLGSDAMKVYAEITKKENDSVYFLSEGKLTTSKDTIDPDYYIRVKKAKFVPKKKVIAGFSNLYIVDIPTPIALPFAYFPLSTGRVAGVLMPTFGNDPNRGYFLQNGGYYIPIGDYADLTLTGDLYTNGSYGIRGQSVYMKRYKFRGNVNFRYENLVTSQKGFDDYSVNQIYNLQISHSQDPKSNPNSRFNASVNLGSSSYFQNSLNRINAANRLNNTLSSSISYSKTFPAYPSVNVSLTATHNQLTNSNAEPGAAAVNMTLPTLQGSVERIFPFAKKDGIKKGIIQNINFQYNVRAENRISTVDSLFLTAAMFDDAKVGARHTIPVNTNFKIAKHFSISVGGNYEDVWTLNTFKRSLDPDNPNSRTLTITDTINGFDRFNRYGLSASIGTTVYGTFNFGEDKKIQAIRHTIRPQISYGYAPSFEQFYESAGVVNGEEVLYSRFQGTLNAPPGLTKSNSLSFSLQNTLEAKVRDKDSTATEPKKISLLSNFNLATSYNFEADSLKLSPISLNGATAFFDKKMALNFRATLDPYAIDNNGRRINTLNIKNGGSLLRLPSASANISYSLSDEIFKKKENRKEEEEENNNYTAASGGRTDDLFGYDNDPNSRDFDLNNNENGKNEDIENPIYRSKIPWDLRLAYVINYTNRNREGTIGNHTLMFSGNIQLSPRWSLRGNSGYDFVGKGFANTNLGFQRDLKSFTLRFDWTPFGRFTNWNFFIGIKSSLLKDLKWENRSQPPTIRR